MGGAKNELLFWFCWISKGQLYHPFLKKKVGKKNNCSNFLKLLDTMKWILIALGKKLQGVSAETPTLLKFSLFLNININFASKVVIKLTKILFLSLKCKIIMVLIIQYRNSWFFSFASCVFIAIQLLWVWWLSLFNALKDNC